MIWQKEPAPVRYPNAPPHYAATHADVQFFVTEQPDHTFLVEIRNPGAPVQLSVTRYGFESKAMAMTWCDRKLQAFQAAVQNMSR